MLGLLHLIGLNGLPSLPCRRCLGQQRCLARSIRTSTAANSFGRVGAGGDDGQGSGAMNNRFVMKMAPAKSTTQSSPVKSPNTTSELGDQSIPISGTVVQGAARPEPCKAAANA